MKRILAIGAAIAMAAACGGGGSDSGGTPTGPSPTTAMVRITSGGVEPKVLTVTAGTVVTFRNEDGRTHEMYTTPHGAHTDCPAINQVGMLTSGQSKSTGALTTVRICGYHDHLAPDDDRFRGQINVGTSEGPRPEY